MKSSSRIVAVLLPFSLLWQSFSPGMAFATQCACVATSKPSLEMEALNLQPSLFKQPLLHFLSIRAKMSKVAMEGDSGPGEMRHDHSMEIFESMRSGQFYSEAMKAIQLVRPDWISGEAIAQAHPQIAGSEISLLALVERIPSSFFQADSGFGVLELNNQGILFSSKAGIQLATWKPEYSKAIEDLIEGSRDHFFSARLDSIHGNGLSLALDEVTHLIKTSPWKKALEDRASNLILTALHNEQRSFIERGHRSVSGSGNLIDIENNLFDLTPIKPAIG